MLIVTIELDDMDVFVNDNIQSYLPNSSRIH